MKIEDSYIARRKFLCGMVGGGTAALGATALGPVAAYVGTIGDELPPFVVKKRAEYELQPGESKILDYGPLPMLLLRTPEPEKALKIFLAKCTHFTCIVGYSPQKERIICGCHDGVFDLEGNVLSGPPPAPLTRFFYTLKGDDLVVALEKENLEKAP